MRKVCCINPRRVCSTTYFAWKTMKRFHTSCRHSPPPDCAWSAKIRAFSVNCNQIGHKSLSYQNKGFRVASIGIFRWKFFNIMMRSVKWALWCNFTRENNFYFNGFIFCEMIVHFFFAQELQIIIVDSVCKQHLTCRPRRGYMYLYRFNMFSIFNLC